MLATIFRRPAVRSLRGPITSKSSAEVLEDRIVLSAIAAAPSTTGSLATLTDIQVNDIQVVNGNQLIANTTITADVLGRSVSQDVEIPIDLSAINGAEGACDILNLEIGAIDLNLLGLQVQTSDICLSITGDPDGGLLGSLLCSIADLNVGDVLDLGGLGDQLDDLLNGVDGEGGLIDLLNGVLEDPELGLLSGGEGIAAQQVGDGAATDILNLSLGPVDLTVLGLNVYLDNCDGGPVTVDITAQSGGGLLGNLLSSIARLGDRDPGNAINAKLNKLDSVLASVNDELLS